MTTPAIAVMLTSADVSYLRKIEQLKTFLQHLMHQSYILKGQPTEQVS